MRLSVDAEPVFVATGGRPFDPGQPAVIFLHGAGLDHTVWALQTRYFAHHRRSVLAPDLPGHGRSDGTALPGIGELADWVDRLMDAAGIETAALVGHSMGGVTALEATARRPARVSALALLGVADRMSVNPELLAAARARRWLAFDFITDWGHGRPAHMGGHPAPGLWLMGADRRLLERGRMAALATDLAACDAYAGGPKAAAKVTCPTLFVLGRLDRMTPAARGRALADAVAGAQVVELPGAGHLMMVEDPGATLDALKAFLPA
ncbi:MAG: alpha/beta fold hydrolase [Kiloniellales bacterium]